MLMTADNLSPLNVPHAFFLRGQENGATEGIYRGLNCGFGSDDDAETVKANRAAAMAALGFSGDALETLHQVHSARVVRVTEPAEAAGRRADALVTASPGVVLGILTADCAPILFYDPDAKVAGAAHAGWRGARFGVAEATVRAMLDLGAARSRISAAIGPAIGPASYEVGPEFASHFLNQNAANARFFRRPAGVGRAFFDLGGYLVSQLSAMELANAVNLAADTVTDAERFFSYRRSVLRKEPDYGRMLSAIAVAD